MNEWMNEPLLALAPLGPLQPLWCQLTSWYLFYCWCCESILESRSHRSGVRRHKWCLSHETWWGGRHANYKIPVTWPLAPWALWWSHHVTIRSPWLWVKLAFQRIRVNYNSAKSFLRFVSLLCMKCLDFFTFLGQKWQFISTDIF